MIMECPWSSDFGYVRICITEPDIIVHGCCPDKVSDQILKCSDILKYSQILQCMQIRLYNIKDKIAKYAVKPKAHQLYPEGD